MNAATNRHLQNVHCSENRHALRQRRSLIGKAARAAGRFGIEALECRTLLSAAFSTVDDFQLVAGQPSYALNMAADAAGNVYAGGAGTDAAGTGQNVVREKFAGSSTWTTILNVPSNSAVLSNTTTESLAVDPAGNLYVAAHDGSSTTIYERLAGQLSFTVIGQLANFFQAQLAIDAAGDVFVSGWDVASPNKYHWIVQKQVAGTQVFTIVDDFVRMPSGIAQSHGITVVNGSGPSAGIYAIGVTRDSALPGGTPVDWIVRKSTDGGSTWTTVDDFPSVQTGSNSTAWGIATDHAGNVYVVGSGSDNPQVWIVRQSATGNAGTWTISDTAPGKPYGVAVDLAGNMYVTGSASDDSGGHSIIRTNASGTWKTEDSYQLVSGHNNWNWALAVGSDGTIYAGGLAYDTSDTRHWIIRSAAGPAPLLGDANGDGVVDIQDQSIVTNHWQKSLTSKLNGDLNGDGIVDIQDLSLITNHWQNSAPSATTSPTLASASSAKSLVSFNLKITSSKPHSTSHSVPSPRKAQFQKHPQSSLHPPLNKLSLPLLGDINRNEGR